MLVQYGAGIVPIMASNCFCQVKFCVALLHIFCCAAGVSMRYLKSVSGVQPANISSLLKGCTYIGPLNVSVWMSLSLGSCTQSYQHIPRMVFSA